MFEWRNHAVSMTAAAVLMLLVIGSIIFLGVQRIVKRLSKQNLRLATALNNMRQGLLLFDSKGRLILCNRRFLQMYNLSPEAVNPGCTLRDILRARKAAGTFKGDPDKYVDKFVDQAGNFRGDPDVAKFIEDGTRIAKFVEEGAQTKVMELPDGRLMSVTNQPMRGGGWVSTHDDITALRHAEKDRDRTQKFLNTVIENIPVTFFVKETRDLRYVLINQAAEDLWGLSRDKIIGKTASDVFPMATAQVINAHDRQLLESGHHLFHDAHQIVTPNNESYLVTSKRIAIFGDNGEPEYLLGVIENVTERARAAERIAHMAHHDALTDLPNRVLLRERLEAELSHVRRGEQLAVLYLDLDNFKNINDTLGHLTGDELLKLVAERLRDCIRDTDTIARLGGDEFAVVRTDLGQPADAAIFAQRLRDAIKAPYELDGHHIIVDVSIGIACAPSDGTDTDQLLKNADLALYGAKADGRGTYRFFEPAMDARMKARRTLELDLRNALANGQIEVHYQPLINLQCNEICGVEALLRWRHSERGVITPAEFIPVAEETGLIIPLGEWVLRQACADAAKWPDDLKVAVNLSPLQLVNENLVPVVVSALAASGLPACRLELEITEAVLLQNTEVTLATLHRLRELGVRIAMDDFGTGYSSLKYLRSFPFDKIKIDRSFVGDLSDKEDSLAIVQAIVSLASSLNMTTTAEGVETQQQLDTVKALGCTEMQGYLFSPARPAKEIVRLFPPRADQVASVA